MSSHNGEFRTFRGYSLADEEQNLTPSMEDYLEMMFRLTPERQYVRLSDLASALNVQPPSATRMVQRLAENGHVRYEKYGILELTPLGRETGLYLLARHNLLESFLRLLGVKDNALKDTERIEHIISEELVSRIHSFVQYAGKNPSWMREFRSSCPPEQPDSSERPEPREPEHGI